MVVSRRTVDKIEERARRIIAAMERRPPPPPSEVDPGPPPPKRERQDDDFPAVTAGFMIGDTFVRAAELAYWTKAPHRCRERVCRRARSCRGLHNRCAFLVDSVEAYGESYRQGLCD